MKKHLLIWPLFFIALSFTPLSNEREKIVSSRLSDFTVYSKEDHIKITWSTHKRHEIESFKIQRSHDNKRFESMRSIEDKGDEPSTMEFFEIDNEPLLGWSYYRILQVTKEGDTAFSGIAPVFFGLDRLTKGEYIAAKNPLDDLYPVNLTDFHDEQILLVLRDSAGNEYYVNQRLKVKGGRLNIQSSNEIAQGIYVISASSKDELVGLEVFAD